MQRLLFLGAAETSQTDIFKSRPRTDRIFLNILARRVFFCSYFAVLVVADAASDATGQQT